MGTTKNAAEVAAAAQAANESINVTSERCVLNVTSVRLIEQDGTANVSIGFAEPIDGYKVVDGVRTPTKVTNLSLNAKYLRKAMYESEPMVALYRATQESGLSQKQLAILLFKSKMIVVRKHHSAGEANPEVEGSFFANDCYSTNIEKVVFSDFALGQVATAVAL